MSEKKNSNSQSIWEDLSEGISIALFPILAIVMPWIYGKLSPELSKKDFASLSGGAQVLSGGSLPEFGVSISFEKMLNAFAQHEYKNLLVLIMFLLVIQGIVSLFMKEDEDETTQFISIIAIIIIPLSWTFSNEVVGMCLLIAALVVVGKRKGCKTEWYLVGPFAMLSTALMIVAFGSDYLTWKTTGTIGIYRVFMHWMVTGNDYIFAIPELIKFTISAGLLIGESVRKNSLGVSFVWGASAFMAMLLGEIPSSQYVGSFWATSSNYVQYYVISCIAISFLLLFWDTFLRDEKDGFVIKMISLLTVVAIGIILWLPQIIPDSFINLSSSIG